MRVTFTPIYRRRWFFFKVPVAFMWHTDGIESPPPILTGGQIDSDPIVIDGFDSPSIGLVNLTDRPVSVEFDDFRMWRKA